jgi:hypothetical protein
MSVEGSVEGVNSFLAESLYPYITYPRRESGSSGE